MGTPSSIRQELVEKYADDELLFADGFDEAILGVCHRFGQVLIVAYDYGRVIEIIQQEIVRTPAGGDCTRGEAHEYFDINVIGAWVGGRTPCFIERVRHLWE